MLHLAILHDWFPSPPPQPGQYLFKNMGQSPQFKPQRENNWFGRLNPFMASPIINCLVFRCCQCNNRAFPETLNQELFCFLTEIIHYTLPELWFFNLPNRNCYFRFGFLWLRWFIFKHTISSTHCNSTYSHGICKNKSHLFVQYESFIIPFSNM